MTHNSDNIESHSETFKGISPSNVRLPIQTISNPNKPIISRTEKYRLEKYNRITKYLPGVIMSFQPDSGFQKHDLELQKTYFLTKILIRSF